MNMGLLTADERLVDELTNVVYKQEFRWVVSAEAQELDEEAGKVDFSHVIVSDRLMGFDVLEEWLDRFQRQFAEVKLMLLLSNYHDAAMNEKYVKMCRLRKLDYIQPGRSIAVIADEIRAWVDGQAEERSNRQQHGKIITFVGSTPNIGTTLTSFGTAVVLARETSATIGYMCLNLKSSKLHRYLGRDDNVLTLDSLRAELKAQSLTAERLRQVCEKPREAPGLHVLFGNMLREQAEFFKTSEMNHLLRTARAAFDVCIVEVNAYWDNAATVCALLEADTRVVATTPDIAQFQEDFSKWIRQVGSAFGLQPDSFELVAMLADRSMSMQEEFTIKDIRKETQLHLLGQISRHGDALALCNQGKLFDLYAPGHAFHAELSALSRKFADYYQLPRKVSLRQTTWLRRMMSGRRAAT